MDDRLRRAAAAEACFLRFDGKTFDPGKRDCVKLATHALIKMGHGAGPVKGLKYSSLAQGVRAMRKAGFNTLLDGLDAMGLPRIAPAMALQGDLIAMPVDPEEDNPFGAALTVAMANGRILGFSGGVCTTWAPTQFVAAWRL